MTQNLQATPRNTSKDPLHASAVLETCSSCDDRFPRLFTPAARNTTLHFNFGLSSYSVYEHCEPITEASIICEAQYLFVMDAVYLSRSKPANSLEHRLPIRESTRKSRYRALIPYSTGLRDWVQELTRKLWAFGIIGLGIAKRPIRLARYFSR